MPSALSANTSKSPPSRTSFNRLVVGPVVMCLTAFSIATAKAPASGVASGLTHCQKVAARTKWINCFKCKQWGKHRANECRLSQDKISALTPHDPEKQPLWEPKGSQFDIHARAAAANAPASPAARRPPPPSDANTV